MTDKIDIPPTRGVALFSPAEVREMVSRAKPQTDRYQFRDAEGGFLSALPVGTSPEEAQATLRRAKQTGARWAGASLWICDKDGYVGKSVL